LPDADIASDGYGSWGSYGSGGGHKKTSLLVLIVVRRL
jgi:hypothetical protein